MVKYGTALSVLLSIGAVGCFVPERNSLVQRAPVSTVQRHVSSPSLYGDFGENSDNALRGKIRSLSASYVDSRADGASDEEDPYEEEVALKQLKKKIIRERSGNYEVSLPIVKGTDLGMRLCEFEAGEISETDLNLNTLRMETPNGEATRIDEGGTSGSVQHMDQTAMVKRLGPTFSGVVVSSVTTDGIAWKKGIRPGHVLVATSATLGEALWPKSTLEGVRSAIQSRKNLSKTMKFELQRVDVVGIAEQYELTVPRPIGLQLQETDDGYVQVSGFTESAPKLIKYAVRKGDRILAVDSLAGRLWPVSTVDGVISACTTRLPGQPVTLSFARPYGSDQTQTVVAEAVLDVPSETVSSPNTIVMDSSLAQTLTKTTTKSAQGELLSRCKDVLRRYMAEAETKMNKKYGVPAIVADRVLEALASSSANLDAGALSRVMAAYLSCQKPESAIRAFEASVGLKGDGSSVAATTFIEGKEKGGGRIVPSTAALNLYTATCLLRAHALTGDMHSVKRVLRAIEGRSGETVDEVEVATWPGTGKSASIIPDTTFYNVALSAAAKKGGSDAIDMALELFDSLADPGTQGDRPQKDQVSYNTIIGALSRAGMSGDAFAVFDQMNMAKVRPDKYTYASLIKACVRDGDMQELMIDMKERGIEPDVQTYNTMIESLCDSYKLFEAKNLIVEMEQRGIVPNSWTYAYLMDGLLKANKPAACLTLFETACSDTRTTAITENVHLYTKAIAATSALGNYERALELISRMNAAGVKPTLKTLTALMSSCLSSGKASMATDVFRKIDNPDGYAKLKAIHAFCEAGELISAAAILSKERQWKRNNLSGAQRMSCYNKLLHSALSVGDFSMARKTLEEFLRYRFVPSKITYQQMIEALHLGPKKRNVTQEPPAEEAFDFLLFVLDSIQSRKLSCDGSFYASVVFCGARMSGSRKKIAALLPEARAQTDETGKVTAIVSEQEEKKRIKGWRDLLLNYEEYKDDIGNEIQLPQLAVNVAKRNIRQVLSGERAVTFRSAKKSTATL